MIEQKDISTSKISFIKIDFNRTERVPAGRVVLNVGLHIDWSIRGVHKERKGVKFKILFTVTSEVIKGKVEAILTTEFNRQISEEEIRSLDSQKACLLESSAYLVQLVSEMTSKMGSTPVIFDISFVENMIKEAKKS